MTRLNETHDPARKSWVESANIPGGDFPIQNLPFCVFSNGDAGSRIGVAIGDHVFDLTTASATGLLPAEVKDAFDASRPALLNSLMDKDPKVLSALRLRLSNLLLKGNDEAAKHAGKLLFPQKDVRFHLPASIGGFTDFFTSLYHTERMGKVTRPDNAVPLNFRYLPIAYNSRASSVRISGEEVRRPKGQRKNPDETISFQPTGSLDYELELGAFIGRGNNLGEPIPIGSAADHVFGYCLVNDWSVRDQQRWEAFPLGPFLAKTLSTTISPFIVTPEALAPFRTPAATRPDGDPVPLPYLHSEQDQREGGLDLVMEALIQTDAMRKRGDEAMRITRTNFKDMYWTVAQMVAHHASNGCNFRTGDLIASGTTSGPRDESRACLAEIAVGGHPIDMPGGEKRTWLEDGDTVVFRAKAEKPGAVSIGFGECVGRILPAHP
jgi:fumarylacetoacetase